MSNGFAQTAILIFTRTASQESAHKTFVHAAGKKCNRSIAARLIRQTVTIARQTRLPVFLHTSASQQAHTFGEKLADALESVFQQGYQRVITIGNDCPELTVSMLLETQIQLEQHPLVLGPATDGGVYLIGIQQTAYQRQAFVELPWETATLQIGWEQYQTQCATDISWLCPLSDIDQASDFKSYLVKTHRWIPLKTLFLSILASLRSILELEYRKPLPAILHDAYSLRGPPV